MPTIGRAIAELETVCGHDIQQRNIGPLAAYLRGSLAAAASSIAAHPHPRIGIITGFYLAHGEPPNCETDGPPGAAMLAAGFSAVGIDCRIATDSLNAPVMRATLAGAGLAGIPLDVVAVGAAGEGAALETVSAAWREPAALSHVIAIERCGPAGDGRPRNAMGKDISAYHAPLDRLFQAAPWTTIGIGDLGNELGMGRLPPALVAASVLNGGTVWCPVAADHAMVAGVSNLAAAALLGALALLKPLWASRLMDRMTPRFAFQLLQAAVRDGRAVSGGRMASPPRPILAVDGIPWAQLEPVYRRLYDICDAAVAGGSLRYRPSRERAPAVEYALRRGW